MQSHNGDGTCNDLGNVQTPCPASIVSPRFLTRLHLANRQNRSHK